MVLFYLAVLAGICASGWIGKALAVSHIRHLHNEEAKREASISESLRRVRAAITGRTTSHTHTSDARRGC
jgi:hypothetical protein